MPGIVGIISQQPAYECESLVEAMVTSMAYERFYTSGTYAVPAMGIYSGWVAHKNSFAAGQVFFNEQKDIALIFGGECFLDPEALADLRQKGHSFARNNGNWLVHLYEAEGENYFEKLNGLFGGLLIDKRQQRAFLFNDRYGLHRLYIHESGGEVYFASEAKALLRILPRLREFDEQGVAQFLTYGCTLEEGTLFRDIRLLPGGSVWSFENGNCHKRKYFSAETWESQPVLSAEVFESGFQETFKRVLPRYFESESRIGISLTGGLDTRMIMACLPQTEEKPICYTFSGEKGLTLDDRLAARVAKACGLEHQLLRLELDFFSDFAAHVDRTIYVTDGCFDVLGAHEVYLNTQARQLAPIRLTGVFGSEIFRAISTFKPMRLSSRLLSPELFRSMQSVSQLLSESKKHPVSFALFKEIPWHIFGSIAACRSQVDFRTPYLDNDLVSLAYQAPESLRKSALVASRLVRENDSVLGNIPTDMGYLAENSGLRGLARSAFSRVTFKLDYLSNDGLPHWLSTFDPAFDRLHSPVKILGLHKYLRYRRWFRGKLAGYLNDSLTDAQARQSPFWNADFFKQMASQHIRGGRNYIYEINAVLTLHAVERLLLSISSAAMDKPSPTLGSTTPLTTAGA